MHITARITGIKYSPFLCRALNTYDIARLEYALCTDATSILRVDRENKIAVSWWVSAKRTRSYPYARVYDSLAYSGKRVTIIPIFKDEGKDGDRDFLQWDTVSLMSLLGVYVIIGYYKDALKNTDYTNKITDQRYDTAYLRTQLTSLLSYQSDALHWNLSQLEKVGEIAEKSLEAYSNISKKLGVQMHSVESARKRIKKLLQGKEAFLKMSRELAQKAQKRESITSQPKEKLTGTKATITITNYLGGVYFFTSDEVELHGDSLFLIEGKHTKGRDFPSLEDIKDGLLRMILLTNLRDVNINDKQYKPIPVLQLTTGSDIKLELLKEKYKDLLGNLRNESSTNGFKITVNHQYLENVLFDPVQDC